MNVATFVADSKQAINVEVEASRLMQDLSLIQARRKPDSLERSQKEDEIYQRLQLLATLVEKGGAQYESSPVVKDLYKAIQGTALPQSVSYPQFGDEFKLFTSHPQNGEPKVQVFLQTMSEQLGTMSPEQSTQVLENPREDGIKRVLETFMGSCGREEFLRKAQPHTCAKCWKEIMPVLFTNAAEMLTVELKRRAHQVREMVKHEDLTPTDALALAEYMEKVLTALEKQVDAAKKTSKQTDWVSLIEALFLLSVGLINEIMTRYVKLLKTKTEMVTGATEEVKTMGKFVA